MRELFGGQVKEGLGILRERLAEPLSVLGENHSQIANLVPEDRGKIRTGLQPEERGFRDLVPLKVDQEAADLLGERMKGGDGTKGLKLVAESIDEGSDDHHPAVVVEDLGLIGSELTQ